MAQSITVLRKERPADYIVPPKGGNVTISLSPSWVNVIVQDGKGAWVRRVSYPSWEVSRIEESYEGDK